MLHCGTCKLPHVILNCFLCSTYFSQTISFNIILYFIAIFAIHPLLSLSPFFYILPFIDLTEYKFFLCSSNRKHSEIVTSFQTKFWYDKVQLLSAGFTVYELEHRPSCRLPKDRAILLTHTRWETMHYCSSFENLCQWLTSWGR